jgi:hypothetical protein
MQTRTFFVVLGLAVFSLVPGEARADSDGYFCAGAGYIALQLRSWNTGGPHLLKVVRLGGGKVQLAGQVELQDFQPHEMLCDRDRVRIAGWGQHYIAYTIDVADANGPVVIEKSEDPLQQFSASLFSKAPGNLGEWARAGVLELASPESEHHYRVVITVDEKKLEGGIEHHIRSNVVVLNREGTEQGRLLLFEGSRLETIHD